MRICVIIPALNEEECIGRLAASLPRPLVSEVIVVDNNSSDRTADVARAAGATVITQALRGYGHACTAIPPRRSSRCRSLLIGQ
jgi:glycosyltransferase involved in cell wall biosynthesis